MSKSTKQVLGLIGAALFVAGLIIGLVPVSSSGTNCGSVFVASDDAEVHDVVDAMRGGDGFRIGGVAGACDDQRALIRVPTIALMVVGGALALVGFGSLAKTPYGDPAQTPREEIS